MLPDPKDARNALARALAETHLECLSAEHDYARLMHGSHDFCQARYGAEKLESQPEALDNWAWHFGALQEAQELGGFGEIPEIPYHPQSMPTQA